MPKVTDKKGRNGRPSTYTQEIADKIIDLIEQGYSERRIAQMDGMPSGPTIRSWKDTHPEFLTRSARARKESADVYNDRRIEEMEWLTEQARNAATSGSSIPKGVVEATRAVMQELAREAAFRDDSRFGDRKTVAVEAQQVGKGLKDFYDSVLKDLKDSE